MAPPPYRLYTPPGSFFAFAPLVVSEFVGISVEVVSVSNGGADIEETIRSKSPTGKAPILESKKGDIIVSSGAIARFLANLRNDMELLGTTGSLRETSAIDDWMNWAEQELELAVCLSYYMTIGCIPLDEISLNKTKNDITNALGVLESHLGKTNSTTEKETYLVLPDQVTLADIVVACYLVYPFTLVFDENELDEFPKTKAWFRNCVQQPEFIAILGTIQCGKGKS